RIPAALVGLAFAGWIAAWLAMRGMQGMAPSAPLFLWLWVATCAAMMLPSLVPAASLAASVGRSSTAFVGGYALVWAASGALAFAVLRLLDGAERLLIAGTILAAALYQLTPFKHAC